MGKRYTKKTKSTTKRAENSHRIYEDEDDGAVARKKRNGKVRVKPVVVVSVIALLLGLLFVELYYVYNKQIGRSTLHNNDTFSIQETEDGHKVFPLNFSFKTADNKDLVIASKISGKDNIVLNFFNSATESCLDILKEYDILLKGMPNAYIVNVNVGDDVHVIDEYIKDNNLLLKPSDVIVDLDMKIFKAFGYEGMPVMAVIDDDGTLIGVINDAMDASDAVNYYKTIVDSDNATDEEFGDNVNTVLN